MQSGQSATTKFFRSESNCYCDVKGNNYISLVNKEADLCLDLY